MRRSHGRRRVRRWSIQRPAEPGSRRPKCPVCDADSTGAVAMSARGDFNLYRRLLEQARPHWAKIAGIFGLDLLASPLALLTPLPLKIVVDCAIGHQPLPGFLQKVLPATLLNSRAAALGVAVVLLLLLACVSQLQSLASSFLRTYTA